MDKLESYLARIRAIEPAFAAMPATLVQDGLINDVVILGHDLVFRFPKNDDWALRLLEHETRVLDLLRGRFAVRIPEIEFGGDGFVGYSFIEGEPLLRDDLLRLDEEQQEAIAAQLADFLRELHSVRPDEAQRAGVGPSDVNRGRDVWLRLYEDVRSELFPLMMPHARTWVERHFAPVREDDRFMEYEMCLVNGDLSPYHILFDPRKSRVSGVIDFGTAGVGDPAADVACIIYQYGESFLRRMTRHAPRLLDGIERARFWAGTLELQWALAGLRRADPSWHLVHIGSARDVLPVRSERSAP
jgi:aminoglycoside 2''-phosphotransferase